ncbi:MAG TPA: glycosyltransferase family 39 protein [Acidimicrobiales bacterium]|nr:glycosyltransferase family 39 protein [Acidimicrobiales bacterium]
MRARPDLRPRVHHVLLLVLMAQFATIGFLEASHDSATVDEAVDVASGIAIVARRDFRMNPEHGPLPKVLSALPALLAHPVIPNDETYRNGAWFDYTDRFIAENRAAGRLHNVLLLARSVAIAQGLTAALLLYLFGRRLAGPWGGTTSAALWLTTPVFIGFSHFAMIDIAFTVALLFVSYRLMRFFDDPNPVTAALCGVACAAAMLTRHNALPIVGVVVLAALIVSLRHSWRAAFRNAATVGIVAFALVWVFYRGIDPTPPTGEIRERFDAVVATAQHDSFAARAALTLPLPQEFRAGLAYLFVTSDERPAYAFGQAWDGSRVWFFPAVALAKLSLITIAVCVAGLLCLRRVDGATRNTVLAALWLPAGTLGLLLLGQPLNLGLRYAFPIIAAFFVCAAPAALVGGANIRRALGVLALAVQVGFVWMATPHSLAWTPPPFTPAYRFVTDSNVDYGQDVERFIHWAEQHRTAAAIVRARGFTLPASVQPLIGTPPSTLDGWVAVSVTNLTALHRDELSWLRAYCPVDSIGGSILLYYFDAPPEATPGPTTPAKPCRGADASRRV